MTESKSGGAEREKYKVSLDIRPALPIGKAFVAVVIEKTMSHRMLEIDEALAFRRLIMTDTPAQPHEATGAVDVVIGSALLGVIPDDNSTLNWDATIVAIKAALAPVLAAREAALREEVELANDMVRQWRQSADVKGQQLAAERLAHDVELNTLRATTRTTALSEGHAMGVEAAALICATRADGYSNVEPNTLKNELVYECVELATAIRAIKMGEG